MHLLTRLLLVCCSSLPSIIGNAQKTSDMIRLNQIGFYPEAPKIAVVLGEVQNTNFYIKTPGQGQALFSGKLQTARRAEFSNRLTRIADFSAFNQPGTYVLEVPELGISHQFEIASDVFETLTKAAIKSYYFQRASTGLSSEFAGKWARPAGHPDDKVLIHASAATSKKPAGTVISASKGWYDAGDYNKYIVNSGITMGTMLSAYEDFPDYFKTLNLEIPESNNNIPDLLDEVLWNLRWMLTMQDTDDGGVYHKLTNPGFDNLKTMPHEARDTRYVVQKSTAATLNFAAVMAQAGRVFKDYESELPGLSDSCMTVAIKAWNWAKRKPSVIYNQENLNKNHDPDIRTGAYGDENLNDEKIWAAVELYISTQKDEYIKAIDLFSVREIPVPSWREVHTLAFYSLTRFENNLTPVGTKVIPEVKRKIIKLADDLIRDASFRAYQTIMGSSVQHFIWGSSAVAANQAIALINAYHITKNKKYLDFALSNLDYILGRNATGYSFVTGFGGKSPKNPHHRPSVAYEVGLPVPGLLVGGPNANSPRQDQCKGYNSAYADEVYIDDECSYASNEVAINWNAPLVYLTAAMEALQTQAPYVIVKQ